MPALNFNLLNLFALSLPNGKGTALLWLVMEVTGVGFTHTRSKVRDFYAYHFGSSINPLAVFRGLSLVLLLTVCQPLVVIVCLRMLQNDLFLLFSDARLLNSPNNQVLAYGIRVEMANIPFQTAARDRVGLTC
jgi:hypothetical protein